MELHTKNPRNKNANSIKNTETTIIIANTKYAINSVPTYNVKAGNNIIQYKPIGKFSNDERTLLNQSLKEGYVYINEAYTLLKKAKENTLEKAETILGELEESTLEALLVNIKQIQDKILSPKLVVLKENYLDTEKDHILASVKEDDTYTFTLYDNFFDKKEFKDNRAGVIIHEIAHLCDIEEGADMYDLDSAECLKNIILCLCEKLSLKQIRQEYARKQEPKERNDDTLTYSDDQPRVPAGSPEGGQWTDSGGSNGGKSSFKNDESKSTAKNKDNSDESNNKTKSNDVAKEQAKVFEALKEETRSFLEKEGLSEKEINAKLEDISLEGMTEIFEEYFDEKFGNLRDIVENSDYPLFTSNGSFAGLMPSRSTNSKNQPYKTVSIKDDKSTTFKYSKEKAIIDGNEIKSSFAISDKYSNNNSNKQYYDSPENAISVGRNKENNSLWMATTVKLEGYKPNSNVSIVIDAYYKDKYGLIDESISVVYDLKTDKNGCLIIDRLGILNAIDGKDDIGENEELEISFEISSIEGRSIDNFGKANGVQRNNDGAAYLEKYKLSDYLVDHAYNGQYDKNKNMQTENYNGGYVGKQKSKNKKTKLLNFKINTVTQKVK